MRGLFGKKVRLSRIFHPNSHRTIIASLENDLTLGPISGRTNAKKILCDLAEGGGNAVVLHRGNIPVMPYENGRAMGLIVQLCADTTPFLEPGQKVLVCTIEGALRLGADAVSFHLDLGNTLEGEMLRTLGMVSGECLRWGLPLMVRACTCGSHIKDDRDPDVVKHAARVAAELGADIAKVNYTGDPLSFRAVTEGCPIPVVIGGAVQGEERALLEMIRGALDGGARGFCVEPDLFQKRNRKNMIRAIDALVHKAGTVEEAQELL